MAWPVAGDLKSSLFGDSRRCSFLFPVSVLFFASTRRTIKIFHKKFADFIQACIRFASADPQYARRPMKSNSSSNAPPASIAGGFVSQLSYMRPSIIRPITSVAVLAMALAGCNRDAGQAGAAGGMPPPLVTVASAIATDVPIYLDEPVGKAVATETVTIQPQVTGMLIARHFEDGVDVHQGDLLFEIDRRPFEALLAQANATLLQNKATLDFCAVGSCACRTSAGHERRFGAGFRPEEERGRACRGTGKGGRSGGSDSGA